MCIRDSAGLLQSTDGRRLEAKVGLEVLSNLTNETLERKLADQKLRALLVATNFTESHRTRLVTVRLLYCIGLAQDMHVIIHTTTSHGCRLASCLGGELLTRGLATG